MMHLYRLLPLLAIPGLMVLTTGCGSSSDSTSTGTSGNTLTATVVDPYIEGAKFCIDTNYSKTCDTGEPTSTLSDASGKITFTLTEPVPENTLIIADPTSLGTHNGVDYTLEMTAIIGAGATSVVISPMTTLQGSTADTNGGTLNSALTNANIVELLQAAGLTDISLEDITADPMANIATLSGTVTNAQLARIRASLTVYAFTRIFNASAALSTLSPTEIMTSGLDTTNSTGSNGVYQVLSSMVTAISLAVSPATIAAAQSPIDIANANIPGGIITLPAVTAEIIVKTGVAIIDRVAGDAVTACNNNSGDHTAGLTAANALLSNTDFNSTVLGLGTAYYGAQNKEILQSLLNLASETSMANLGAPADLDTGMACTTGHFTVDASLVATCVQ